MLSIFFIIEVTQTPRITHGKWKKQFILSLWKEFMQLSKVNNLDPEESLHTERIWSDIWGVSGNIIFWDSRILKS